VWQPTRSGLALPASGRTMLPMTGDQPSATRRGDNTPPSPRVAIVAPIYNHASAVRPVLDGLGRYGLPIIVVNDGSTDGTAGVLDAWRQAGAGTDRRVVTHAANRGKADALRSGFAESARLGFTHAVTIDTDGQHDTADLQRLLDLVPGHPGALIVGAREREGSEAPGASRVGRALSNGMVWIESGVRVTDSQSGMRVYPLEHMGLLSGRVRRYGFETEVLTRAGWLGVPVVETTIRCIYDVPGGRTTHFNLRRDTLAHIGMHAGLFARAHMPGHPRVADANDDTGTIPRRLGRWFSPRRLRRMARGDAAMRERLAASIGVGLLIATLPIYGLKTLVCLWVAGRFRLHPLAVLGVSSLSTPPLGLLFVAASVWTGSFVLHGHAPDLSGLSLQDASQWSTVNTLVAEWLVGSVVAGVALGLAGYGVMRLLLRERPIAAKR